MSIEAMKLALEALEKLSDAADGFSVSGVYFNEEHWAKECLNKSYDAITTLRQAIEQAQKPVEYTGNGTAGREKDVKPTGFFFQMPKPLTSKQIREIEVDVALNQSFDYPTTAEQFARAIEAAHGIKGEA